MFKLDHFVINIDKKYQKDKDITDKIINSGFKYEPSWGKGTRGFKVSNIWIGNEYFEMVNILKSNGGGWLKPWVDLYNEGYRGLICLMLDVNDIEKVYEKLRKKNIDITKPEYLKFKWCFNLLTRTMPWKNSYVPFFKKIPLQIGFQQMKDEKARDFMNQYMVPNSRENGISGIRKVVIEGDFVDEDFKMIEDVFGDYITNKNPLTIKLNSEQNIQFKKSDKYKVYIYTNCENDNFIDRTINIENVSLINSKF